MTRADQPAYRALADQVRQLIWRGEYTDDRRLPTEHELARQYGLSRQTVRRAYLELVSEGVVDRVPGRGSFVAERQPKYAREFGSVDDLLDFSLDTDIRIVAPLAPAKNGDAAERLALTDDTVHRVEYIRMHQHTPFAWTTVSLPPPMADLLRESSELHDVGGNYAITIIGLLERLHPGAVEMADQTISAVAADEQMVEHLRCELGSPLLRIDRLFLDGRGQAVELSTGYFLPEHYRYRARLRRSGS